MKELTLKNRKFVLRKIEAVLLRSPMGRGTRHGGGGARPAQIRAAAKQILQRSISQQRKGLIAPLVNDELIKKIMDEAQQGGAR